MRRLLYAALALCLWALPATAESPPRVRGLLIGISEYKDPAWPRLAGGGQGSAAYADGHVRPVRRLSREFSHPRSGSGYPQGAARRSRATDERAPAGETVVVFYAGHGDQVKDRVPPADCPYEKLDEQDGMDECLVPFDAPAPTSPQFADAVVRDDFVEDILSRLLGKVRSQGQSGSVVLIFDSCHSGTISRSAAAGGRIARTSNLPHPQESGALPGFVHAQSHGAGSQGWVVLSACAPRQTAKELPVGGDFTTALTQALEDHRLALSPTIVSSMRLVNQVGEFSDQQPQAEGDLDLALLGGGAQIRQPSIKVTNVVPARNSFVLTLDKGSLLGITAGSEVGIYPLGSSGPEARKLASGQVLAEGLSAYQAKVRIEGAPPSLKADDLSTAVAWVTRQAVGDMEIKLHLSPSLSASAAADFKKMLSSVSMARLVNDARQADVVVLPSKGGLLSLERCRSAIGPDQIVQLAPGDSPARLAEAIHDEARRAYLSKLINEPQKLRVEMQAGRFEGSTFKPASLTTGADGLPVFRGGGQGMLKITNSDTQKLYISVLSFGSRGRSSPSFPTMWRTRGRRWDRGRPWEWTSISLTMVRVVKR